jgi:hypothetical protein
MALVNLHFKVILVDWSGGWRLQRNQRDRRDPGLSVAREAARRSPAGTRPPGTEIDGTCNKRALE